MAWRWGKRLLLRKSKRPYRVLCVGDHVTYGQVGSAQAPYYDPDGIGFVERMAQRMAPYCEFINVGDMDVSTQDFLCPANPDYPTEPRYGGAYELLVEPHLEATTGEKIDLAVLFFGFTDAGENLDGSGWYEDLPVHPWSYIAAIGIVIEKLFAAGVGKALVLTPLEWQADPGYFPKVGSRLLDYRTLLKALVDLPTVSGSIGALDVYRCVRPDQYPPFRLGERVSNWWPKQAGHDRLAVVVGRYIRQSTHYQLARPGGPGVTAPFKELDHWQE